MELITRAPKGTADITSKEMGLWQTLEFVLKSEAEMNGFSEIRTPVFEHTELFLRGMGDTTDVVEKQMYTFEDKGGRSITLRPEGTAGVARSMLEHGLYNSGYPIKAYYNGTFYRYEKPQAGRMRELHQFGVEMFGAAEPQADVQVIAMAMAQLERLGLRGIELVLNSIGCPECRAVYHKALKEYFVKHIDKLCDSCKSRLERNPMRILDCKSPVCSEIANDAPKITDYLCDECKEHFNEVKRYLDALKIKYTLDDKLVRGLDYYTRTVFEFVSNDIGAQSSIGGGGRYDGLIEELGGNPTAAVGYALGMDRIILVMEAQRIEALPQNECELFIATMNAAAVEKAMLLTNMLHKCGIISDTELCGRGLKAQMKYADRINAKFTMVLGDDEVSSGRAEIKNMKTGEKREISLGEDFIDDYLTVASMADDLAF